MNAASEVTALSGKCQSGLSITFGMHPRMAKVLPRATENFSHLAGPSRRPLHTRTPSLHTMHRHPTPFRALLPLLAILLAQPIPALPQDPPPPQGTALLKSDILAVFAHPDDETGMAASLAHYALAQGKVIAHAYATRGEGGGNMVGTQAGPALGILRETELRDALRILGIRHVHFLDQQDFFYTESLSGTFRKWNKEVALEKLVRIIRALRPDLILTMNPAPNPGQHGHHQAAGVLATEAFLAAADPSRFPAQIAAEGLHTWQARKLFYAGTAGSHITTITTTQPLPDGRIPADIAGEALSHHRSQAFGGFLRSPWLRRPQSFTLVQSTVTPNPSESDLFAGLTPTSPDPTPNPSPIPFAQEPPPVDFAFIPRPAISQFRLWAARHQVSHLAAVFPVDLPVVAGEENTLELEVPASFLRAAPDRWEIQSPPGWTARIGARPRASDTPGRLRFPVFVNPPPDAAADADLLVTAFRAQDKFSTLARLHPVPRLRVPASLQPPALDGTDTGWDHAASFPIGTNQTWQGRAESPADCSAVVRLVHTADALFVDVRVLDDAVISNIQPDDIKGHWRSDSVEICIDPAAGAEDTTGCFKVGIFPFDTTGKVRAARDADALQGPVESTAPGFRIVSRRTDDGYRIQAAIPWTLIVNSVPPPQRLGFNVLVYDGDKPDAAPGENINKTRIAWAPRSGVQGRPEDWGRIDLD